MPTIGVFDSGFGGLTVLRELLPLIPSAHYIYVGDTARLPYGAKSQATIARYAVESARFLESRGANLLVIACNTATALALPDIQAAVQIPVIGVVQPGAQAAQAAVLRPLKKSVILSEASWPHNDAQPKDPEESNPTPTTSPFQPPATTPQILVLATTATVQSHAYRSACESLHLQATEVACPLLVPLVEEGWVGDQPGHHITREVLRLYLTDALQLCTPDAVLLGCTHYPLIAPAIEQTLRDLNSHALVIDSARATAQATAAALNIPPSTTPVTTATFECHATDSIEKFQRLGATFLHQPIPKVHLLDLGG